jgi:hypothetical protein
VCIRNAGFGESLEVRKLYPVVEDLDARQNDLIRVIDELDEDETVMFHMDHCLSAKSWKGRIGVAADEGVRPQSARHDGWRP